MATYQSGADTMRAYARGRVHDADQILARHQPDGAGCCTTCGRPIPCDDSAHAARLREHYRAWLDTPTLVRLYVLPGGGA
jgi:hypothetical protein